MALTIVKLTGTDGQPVWTQSLGDPLTGFEQPVMLACDGGELTIAAVGDTYNGSFGVGVRVVSASTGTLKWSTVLIDDNIGLRCDGQPSTDGYKTPISLWNGQAIGGVTVSGDHVYITTPRTISRNERYLADGGDVWGISRYGTTLVTTPTYSVLSDSSSVWAPYAGAMYGSAMQEGYIGTISTATRGINATAPVTSVVDRLHSLPPVYSHSSPSLDVVNVARVGQLVISNTTPAPASLMGQPGDVAGSIRAGDVGLYYCTDTYSGSGKHVWSVAEFTDHTAPRFKSGPIGYNPTDGMLCGGKSDRIGDIRMIGATMFVCTRDYVDTLTAIWEPVKAYTIGAGVIATPTIDYVAVTDANFVCGYVVSTYDVNISVGGGGSVYDISGGCSGKPAAGAVLMQFNAIRSINVTIALTGWTVGTASADMALFDITVDDNNVGYVSFWPGSTTVYDAAGSTIAIGAGSVLRVLAPAVQDATLADVSFTLAGSA